MNKSAPNISRRDIEAHPDVIRMRKLAREECESGEPGPWCKCESCVARWWLARHVDYQPKMKLAILHHTTDYRGDHSADVAIAVEPKPGETVEELVQRVNLGLINDKEKPAGSATNRHHTYTADRIEIRVVGIEA